MDCSVSSKHQQEYHVKPCIAELLRTGYHPPELILRVERVIEVPIVLQRTRETQGTKAENNDEVPESPGSNGCNGPSTASKQSRPTYKTYRVFLGDSELVIQALFRRELHYFVSTAGEILPGAILGLENFEVRTGSRRQSISGRSGNGPDKIVYLAVERFRTVNCSSLPGGIRQPADQVSAIEQADPMVKRVQVEEDEYDEERQIADNRAKDTSREEVTEGESSHKRRRLTLETPPHPEIEPKETKGHDQTGHWPTLEVEPVHTDKISEVAEKAPTSSRPARPSSFSSPIVRIPESQKPQPSLSQTHHTYSHPTPQSRTLNLRTLAYLLHPPTPRQKRNYICDIIGVISWISPQIVKRPSMPPKRDLRIIDPTILTDLEHRRSSSTSSNGDAGGGGDSGKGKGSTFRLGMALSVFVDAAGFNPPQGTVALFRTLRTHEWEGTSLNAYDVDCKGKEWFVTDSRKLVAFGVDVGGMKRWWSDIKNEYGDICG